MPPGDARATHWDLMLESGESLRTWALADEPHYGDPISADLLPDHRLPYLDYEGPISAERGSVTRWTEGEFEFECDTTMECIVRLRDGRLPGKVSLTREVAATQRWTAVFSAD